MLCRNPKSDESLVEKHFNHPAEVFEKQQMLRKSQSSPVKETYPEELNWQPSGCVGAVRRDLQADGQAASAADVLADNLCLQARRHQPLAYSRVHLSAQNLVDCATTSTFWEFLQNTGVHSSSC